jgi:glycosyltransferase involved in cell wall biosynthesis
MINLTVVMTIYERLDYFEEALNSLFAANNINANLYLLIYNDGASYKKLVEAIYRAKQNYKNSGTLSNLKPELRIGVISSTENRGFAYALDKAIRHAPDGWIFSLDSDDILEPHAITTLIDYIEANEHSQFLYSNYWEIDWQGNKIREHEAPSAAEISGNDLWGKLPFHLTCFTKDLYLLGGGINLDHKYAVDVDLYLKMLELTIPVHIPESLYQYRRHADQMSSHADQQVVYTVKAINAAIERRGLPYKARLNWVLCGPDHPIE